MKITIIFIALLILVSCTPALPSSSCNKISIDDVVTYKSQTIINKEDISKGRVQGTGSMLPIIPPHATILYVVPKNEEEICVGDVVYYTPTQEDCGWLVKYDIKYDAVLHRVIEKRIDTDGEYFLLKGDSNGGQDPCKVRFKNIKQVMVGIIY